MEHELFQSELKPSVDGALISSMIRSSSSGLHSHRAVAMASILERSIQERRERTFAKAKDELRPDPAPQPGGGAPNDTTGRGIEVGRGEGPPVDIKTDPSPQEDFVELACSVCGVKQLRSSILHGVGCSLCSWYWAMNCTGCGTSKLGNDSACASCHRKFK